MVFCDFPSGSLLCYLDAPFLLLSLCLSILCYQHAPSAQAVVFGLSPAPAARPSATHPFTGRFAEAVEAPCSLFELSHLAQSLRSPYMI